MMKMYSIGEFSKNIGVTAHTLRVWHKEEKLIPYKITDGGTRYYSQSQLDSYYGINNLQQNRKVVGYCRVSSHKQKDDLERQVEDVQTFMSSKGYEFEMITDIGSGINYNKKGLNKLIKMIVSGSVSKIVILYKDRLIRFGYELIENLCEIYGTEIEIIDTTCKTEDQELVEDLIQIVTVLSCRLEGRRANKAKKMIKELMEHDSSEED